jgi:hypothetical protein
MGARRADDTGDDEEELPRITASPLRRAGTICARRLANEHHDRRSMRRGTGRFRVQNQLLEDARLTHVDFAQPDPAHFRPGHELTAEEAHLYRTAARWYVALYHDERVRSVDLGTDDASGDLDNWATCVDEIGVRLVGRCGLTVEHDDGRRGVRLLRLGRGVPGADLLDDVDVRFAVLRLSAWSGAELCVSVGDLVHGARRDGTVDGPRVAELQRWLAGRVDVVRARAAEADPTPGLDCASCAFVPGCPAHR